MSLSADRSVFECWKGAAPGWIEHAEAIALMSDPVTQALVDRLDPRPGDRLLDLACGAGDPALSLAGRTGGRALVVALDPVEALVASTGARAQAKGVDRLATVNARAQALPFQDSSFSAASCRFGGMFILPLDACLADLRRVLSADARVVFAVWGERAANPYFTVVHEVLDGLGAAPLPQAPGLPTVFELAEPGALAARFRRAGFGRAQDEPLAFALRLPDTAPGAFLDRQAGFSPSVASRLDGLDPAVVASARALVGERMAPWRDEAGGLALPALARLVTARR